MSVYQFLCRCLDQSVSVSVDLCLYLYLLCQPVSVSVLVSVTEKMIATCTSANVLEKKEEMKVRRENAFGLWIFFHTPLS